MNSEQLWDLFQIALKESANTAECAEALIQRVVDSHVQKLTSIGTIPHFLWEDVVSEIEMEVTEMYRKKTYGFMSLQDYHQNQRLRNKQK